MESACTCEGGWRWRGEGIRSAVVLVDWTRDGRVLVLLGVNASAEIEGFGAGCDDVCIARVE